jgi:pimeloyl-ACP methyl ester carboxylesterase
MERAADDLEAIRRDLLGADGRWFVYGVSYGGMLAQAYASKYPAHLDGLVLDSTFHDIKAVEIARRQFVPRFIEFDPRTRAAFEKLVERYPELRLEALRRMRLLTYSYATRIKDLPELFERAANQDTRAAALALLKEQFDLAPPLTGMVRDIFCEQMWDYSADAEANAYFWWVFARECAPYEATARPIRMSESLRALKMRSFIWAGGFDPVAPVEVSREMRDLVPGALYWENRFAGHGLLGEKNACATELLSRFIRGESSEAIAEVARSEACQSAPELE